jgi:sugar (pentulose or hexulose) kinase
MAKFIGIDIGTQGLRLVLTDAQGRQLASRSESFAISDAMRREQSPTEWWTICQRQLQSLCHDPEWARELHDLQAIAVTSTSGTVVALDKQHQPLHAAIMYSDGRSAAQAARCNEAASAAGMEGYFHFNSSCGLPKMLWFLDEYPEKKPELGLFVHAADYITGCLSGDFTISDYSNALKSGYDLEKMEWPDYIFEDLGFAKNWLPAIVAPGTIIRSIHPKLATELGLPSQVKLVAGITDGCASQIATGAVNPGDWNTTIGTTLVIKGVTRDKLIDPTGSIYCHRHPDGYWMPGGASNTGADWVSKWFGDQDLALLNKEAEAFIPTGLMAWPLLQEGERFPILSPEARGFMPDVDNDILRYAACMEAVAYVERLAYERIEELSGEKVNQVFTAGGASSSDTWLRIRASVLQKPVRKMENVQGANGAAILAASQTYYSSLAEAAEAMTRMEKLIQPEIALIPSYENSYHRFIKTLKEKKYLPTHAYA